MSGGVWSLTVYENQLIAGGAFATAGGIYVDQIAAWNGSSWSSLGSGTNGSGCVYALTVYDNQLIAGRGFTSAGNKIAAYLAQWTKRYCGDSNADGSVNISDAVWIINYIFVGGHAPCDFNGDGTPDC